MGALDLHGHVVGDLTVVAPTEGRDTQGNIVWTTRCKCGCEQRRTAAYLRAAILDGRRCGCPRCLRGRRVERASARAENRVASMLNVVERLEPGALASSERTQAWLRLILDWYGLYGLGYDSREAATLRAECAAALGEPEHHESLYVVPKADTDTDSGRGGGQLWSNLYPMHAPGDHGYQCAQCTETRERGWGCVECMCFVCYECGAGELHRCCAAPDEFGGVTLDVVALKLGVSRERVRQIEGKACRKVHWLLQQAAGVARARRLGARVALMSRFPNTALKERLMEMRLEQARAQYEVAKLEREAADRYERQRRESALAHDRACEAERLWSTRIAESMAVMLQLKKELWRQVAVHAVGGDPSKLPWSLRYPSIQARFGNSATTAESADGMFSCVRCKLIVIDPTPEAMAHKRGDCTFVFAPPQWVVRAVTVALDINPLNLAPLTVVTGGHGP